MFASREHSLSLFVLLDNTRRKHQPRDLHCSVTLSGARVTNRVALWYTMHICSMVYLPPPGYAAVVCFESKPGKQRNNLPT